MKVAFQNRAREMLALFPRTEGQCVGLCACISAKLDEDRIPHSVALGSLSCNGIKAFQYVKAFPSKPSGPIVWDGHAWIEFSHGYIGEPSLLRTARVLPDTSNIKQHLQSLGIIGKGAILLNEQAKQKMGLKYTRKAILRPSLIASLAAGLISINDSSKLGQFDKMTEVLLSKRDR